MQQTIRQLLLPYMLPEHHALICHLLGPDTVYALFSVVAPLLSRCFCTKLVVADRKDRVGGLSRRLVHRCLDCTAAAAAAAAGAGSAANAGCELLLLLLLLCLAVAMTG